MARKMKALIEHLDGSRPVTGGTNGPLESEGVVNVVDIMGFNYMQYAYDQFHKIFSNLPILGTETSSYMTTRGMTKNDPQKTHVCCFGTEPVINLYPWASTTGDTWKYIYERDFVMGGFDWTGFDYRGECGKYPATVCNFGAMDLCGFPKDSYYWHKVIWREEAQIYLSPAWNGTEGETTKFACYSNCERVVIKVNGDIVYDESHDKYKSVIIDTVYHNGVVEALGYIGGEVAANALMNSFGKAHKIVLEPHKSMIRKNNEDLCFIVVRLEDECGNTVPDANNLINFKINENGKILGVGNGDSCFPNEENVPYVNLFNGYGLVVIAAESDYGEIVLEAESDGIESNRITIQIEKITENCRHIESEKVKIKQTFWQQTDIFAEPITERVLNEPMFAWSPTVVGYGENIKFSEENGYGAICTKFGVTDSMRGRNIKLCFEKVYGEFDLYIGKKFIGTFKNVENIGFDVPSDVGELTVSVIFKLSGEKCGIPGLVYLDVE